MKVVENVQKAVNVDYVNLMEWVTSLPCNDIVKEKYHIWYQNIPM